MFKMFKMLILYFDKILLRGIFIKTKIFLNHKKYLKAINLNNDYSIKIYYPKDKDNLLAKLADKYGSDKGEISQNNQPYEWKSHSYTDYYTLLFLNSKDNIKLVFECGIGTNNPNLISNMGVNGKPGASLRMWEDYFPNASIYGADIDKYILVNEGRIKSFFLDQLNPKTINKFWKIVDKSNFHIMIDDGLHTFEAGKCLFENSISKLSSNGYYLIEDVHINDLVKYNNYFENKDYDVKIIILGRPETQLNENNIVQIRHKIIS